MWHFCMKYRITSSSFWLQALYLQAYLFSHFSIDTLISVLDRIKTLLDTASLSYLHQYLHQQWTATATSDKTDISCQAFSYIVSITQCLSRIVYLVLLSCVSPRDLEMHSILNPSDSDHTKISIWNFHWIWMVNECQPRTDSVNLVPIQIKWWI